MHLNKLGLLLIGCIFVGFTPPNIALAQDSTPVIYSYYETGLSLDNHFAGNFPGSDGMGLHYSKDSSGHYTIPGIDTWGNGNIFSPMRFCQSNGDRVFTVDDDVGNGGHGLVLEQGTWASPNRIKIMLWHLSGYTQLLLNKIQSGECIEAKDHIAYEGSSLSIYVPSFKITTFQEAGWSNEPHSHASIGKETPWNNGCTEIFVNGWSWTNPICVSTPWEISGTNAGNLTSAPSISSENMSNSTRQNVLLSLLESSMYTPKDREIVNLGNLEPSNNLPIWALASILLVTLGIFVVNKLGQFQ